MSRIPFNYYGSNLRSPRDSNGSTRTYCTSRYDSRSTYLAAVVRHTADRLAEGSGFPVLVAVSAAAAVLRIECWLDEG